MKDNEIIKGLECHTITMKCGECPYDNAFIGDGDVEINVIVNNNCFKGLGKDAIDLINRQQAEIKALKMDKEQLESDISNALGNLDHMTQLYEGAIKEFADKLKNRLFNYYDFLNENTGKNYDGCETLMAYEIADMIKDCIEGVLDES